MLLRRVLLLALVAGYVGYRLYLALALARARRTGDTLREQALRAGAARATRWAVGIVVAGGAFLVLLVVLNARS